MPTDFRNAAERHYNDAGYLLVDKRLANADHLYGLSAECALKSVMKGLGMKVDQTGKPEERQYRVHINDLWDEFITFANGLKGSMYSARLDGVQNCFEDWRVDQRYFNQADITGTNVESHKQGACIVKSVLDQAILDGVVS